MLTQISDAIQRDYATIVNSLATGNDKCNFKAIILSNIFIINIKCFGIHFQATSLKIIIDILQDLMTIKELILHITIHIYHGYKATESIYRVKVKD